MRYRIPIIFIILVALIVGVFVYRRESKNTINSVFKKLPFFSDNKSNGEVSEASLTYNDQLLPFSFKYPSDFHTSSFTESADFNGEEIRVILVQDKSASGFQIVITPFTSADTKVTEERIKKEVPDLVISDAESIFVGRDANGLAFVSGAQSAKQREVWFIYNEYLYQISAPLEVDKTVQAVLNSWQFK